MKRPNYLTIITNSREEPKEIQEVKFSLPTLTEIAGLNIQVEWVVEKIIPKEAITVIHGKGGIGKTWLLMELGRCVSEGLRFFDLNTRRMPVYYIDFENSEASLVERAKILGGGSMKVWHLSVDPSPPKIDWTEWVKYKELEPGLIIFDTFRACQEAEENSSTEMAKVISRFKELRAKRFTVILIHHTTKNGENFRGSQAILDLCDHVLSMERVKKVGSEENVDTEDWDLPIKLGIKDKTRFSLDLKPLYFKFKEGGALKLVDDPDTEAMKKMQHVLKKHCQSPSKGLGYNTFFELVQAETDIAGKKKFDRLVKKGEGQYWPKSRGKGKKAHYYPL